MKKLYFLLAIWYVPYHVFSQRLVNPYKDYVSPTAQVSPYYENWYFTPEKIQKTWRNKFIGGSNAHNGEYEIFIGDLFWRTEYPDLITYDIETVGFPFMKPTTPGRSAPAGFTVKTLKK